MDDGGGGREGLMIMDVMWFQVDLDYEFDAPRWFDLTQEEAPRDAAAAQEWFAAAPSYPPSRACSLPFLLPSPRDFQLCVSARGGLIRGHTGMGVVPCDRLLRLKCDAPAFLLRCVTAGLVGEFGFRKWTISRVFFLVLLLLLLSRPPQCINDRRWLRSRYWWCFQG